MVDILAEIPKWITLSVRKDFVSRVQNAPVFYEETIKLNNQEKKYIELRIDGPYITPEGTKDHYVAYIEVNALVTVTYDEKDSIGLVKLGGVAVSALSHDICVYKLGPESTDDKSYFETLQLVADDNVEFSNFGQIDPTNNIYQGTVEAHYKLRFKNGTVRP